jgi:hypothetical protein
MRILITRGMCCGLSKEGCLALVQAWLTFHALQTGIALAFEHCFSHQYEIAEGYLERRGVQRIFEQKRRERLRRRLERITQRTSMRLLLLIADNPGVRRCMLQRELGLETENLKDHLERLIKKNYLERVGFGRYTATDKAEALLSRLESAWCEAAAQDASQPPRTATHGITNWG